MDFTGYVILIYKISVCIFLFVFAGGCASVRITDPPQTATEQFLLSNAAQEAVGSFTFKSLFSRKVYVDSSHFAPAKKEFVLGEFRAGLFKAGAQIANDPNNAEIIIEVRSSGVGIDRYENLLGIPSIGAPAGAAAGSAATASTPTVLTPELAITKNVRQYSFASIAYVAYWKDSGEVLVSEGPAVGKAVREDFWFLGIGPKTAGDIVPVEKTDKDL